MSARCCEWDALLACSVPGEPVARTAHPAARYDFGVAYPDPDSLPLDQLVECLREELAVAGRSLAHYPHPLGYPAAARVAGGTGLPTPADSRSTPTTSCSAPGRASPTSWSPKR